MIKNVLNDQIVGNCSNGKNVGNGSNGINVDQYKFKVTVEVNLIWNWAKMSFQFKQGRQSYLGLSQVYLLHRMFLILLL